MHINTIHTHTHNQHVLRQKRLMAAIDNGGMSPGGRSKGKGAAEQERRMVVDGMQLVDADEMDGGGEGGRRGEGMVMGKDRRSALADEAFAQVSVSSWAVSPSFSPPHSPPCSLPFSSCFLPLHPPLHCGSPSPLSLPVAHSISETSFFL